ncbi:hypothetical protein [Dorea sp. D27]|uniref:hypothetical protein n=1 Tax=Dorea sp. D27 TaxID=658665 RepID=UPI0018DE5579|nr:hypothetical protein [Dorea sp. D27]
MKRKVISILLLLCLIAGMCYYISLPDYHVRNSMSLSNQGTRDTALTVVYKYWGINETIRNIGTAAVSPNCAKLPVRTYKPKERRNLSLQVCQDILQRSTINIIPMTPQTLLKRKKLSKTEMPNSRIWHTLDNPNQSQPTFLTPKN